MKQLFCALLLVINLHSLLGQTNELKKIDTDASTFIKNNSGEKGLVIFFLDPECPMCQKYTYTINKLSKENSELNNLNFIGVFSGKGINESTISDYIKRYKIQFPAFLDTGFIVSDFLAAKVTPEVFLLDENEVIFYRGMIDNWYYMLGKRRNKPTENYLEENIKSLLSRQAAKYPSNKPFGCIISRL